MHIFPNPVTYDDILDMIQITDKKLLHFKLSKLGQILRVDKTCFPRPCHICMHNVPNVLSNKSPYKIYSSMGQARYHISMDEPLYKNPS